MSDTSQQLTIPATPEGVEQAVSQVFTTNEAELLLQAIEVRKRNRRIRREFGPLRRKHGYSRAIQRLAAQEGIAFITVKKILYAEP